MNYKDSDNDSLEGTEVLDQGIKNSQLVNQDNSDDSDGSQGIFNQRANLVGNMQRVQNMGLDPNGNMNLNISSILGESMMSKEYCGPNREIYFVNQSNNQHKRRLSENPEFNLISNE
jgi:hypothetical protein